MKKLLFLSLILLTGFIVRAQTPTLILFHGEECPHCKVERIFLEDLKKKMPGLEIIEYEVWHNEANRDFFLKTIDKLGIKEAGVPLTIVADQYLIGFDNAENYGEKIKAMIENSSASAQSETVSHPLFGKIDLKNISLPFMTLALGTLDGFNPCSMWSLLVLLTLVVATGSRKKIWLVGGVFILTSAISYFLFMTAWLNAFIFLDYIKAIQVIVGIIALVAGVVSIKEFYTYKPGVCEVSTPEKQKKIMERIKSAVGSPTIFPMIISVMMIAFSVNIIELLCSLGIPVIYTKALSMHHLASWKYYTYLGFYDFFYMLDDIILVLIVGFSMKIFHLNSAYSRYSRLIAGILMLVLGLIFLINPQLLMFK